MKLLQRIMKRRWRESSSSRKLFTTKKSSKGDATEDSTDDEYVQEDNVPWRAENFLGNSGPPNDSDWWKDAASEPQASVDEDGNESTTSASPTDEVPLVQNEKADHASNDEDPPFKGKVFQNKGFAIWSQGRQAWRTVNRDESAIRASPIPASFRKELVKCLSDRRPFELSQRIPLADMIDSYQDVWRSGGAAGAE